VILNAEAGQVDAVSSGPDGKTPIFSAHIPAKISSGNERVPYLIPERSFPAHDPTPDATARHPFSDFERSDGGGVLDFFGVGKLKRVTAYTVTTFSSII